MKEIPLTKGKVALVDDEDYENLIGPRKWRVSRSRKSELYYAVRWSKFVNGKRKTELMHRLVANTPEGVGTDHKDGNGLNNQRSNLRSCTEAENRANRGKQVNNKSGFKGVFPVGRKWMAYIRARGRRYHLGMFPTPESAARAYDKSAAQLHGRFAAPNFPKGDIAK